VFEAEGGTLSSTKSESCCSVQAKLLRALENGEDSASVRCSPGEWTWR
jgi:hypothetical protein